MIDEVAKILNFGWPAIVTIMVSALYRDYIRSMNSRIEFLEDLVKDLLDDTAD